MCKWLKKSLLFGIVLTLATTAYAQPRSSISQPVDIEEEGGLYFLRLDFTNDPTTGAELDLGSGDITSTDLDITAGTGDYTSTGTLDAAQTTITGIVDDVVQLTVKGDATSQTGNIVEIMGVDGATKVYQIADNGLTVVGAAADNDKCYFLDNLTDGEKGGLCWDEEGEAVDIQYEGSDVMQFGATVITGLNDLDWNASVDITGQLDVTGATAITGKFQVGDGTNMLTIDEDGDLALVGTARVYNYAWMSAGSVRGVGANPASEALNDSGFIILEFANAADDYAQANIKIPSDMDLSVDSYICLGWSVPNQSESMVWGYGYLVTAMDGDTQAAATANTATVVSSGTVDGLNVSPIITIAGGTLTVNDVCLHIYIYRDVSYDDYGVDVDLHGMAFKYTSNKLGENQ